MWRKVLWGIVALSCGCNLFSSTPESVDDDVDNMASDTGHMASDAGFDLTEATDVADLPDDMPAAPDAACMPESDEELCDRLVVNCDTINAEDNCGNVRTANCGICTTPAECGGGGTPNVCACPDQTDADFCMQQGAVCGGVTAIDVCGAERTVSCGTCNAPEECMGGACVCVPENDAEFCMAEAAECGTLTATDRCDDARTTDCGGCGSGELCEDNVCVDALCPNGVCDTSEDATNCPQDCGAIALAAGAQHTCAVRADGQLLCWGGDSDGQLGIGGSAAPAPPTLVNSAADPATMVAAAPTVNGLGTCAAGPTGLFCWGNGEFGQNGVGATGDRHTPQRVTSTVPDAIGVGSDHRCYAQGASVFCWGEGQYGRLGTGDEADHDTPGAAGGFSANVLELALGDRHTCARLNGRTVECVGSNLNGQQGNGMGGSGMWNVVGGDVGLSDVEAIAAGHDHNCVVVDGIGAHDVYCWGLSADGQVGNAGTANQLTPVLVASAGTVLSITAGTAHTCMVDGNGDVTCWGRNAEGQLGLSGTGDRTSPAPVSLPFDVSQITAGHHHTCAITDDGQIYCWGANAQGQLGDTAAAGGSTPVKVPF